MDNRKRLLQQGKKEIINILKLSLKHLILIVALLAII